MIRGRIFQLTSWPSLKGALIFVAISRFRRPFLEQLFSADQYDSAQEAPLFGYANS